MTLCPHCGHQAVTFQQKWHATMNSPAECNRCHNYSFVPAAESARVGLVAFVMLLVAGGLGVALHSPLMAASIAVLALAIYAKLWQRLPLWATYSTSPCPDKTNPAWIGLEVIGAVLAATH
jgi:hypothetical protein